MKKIILFITALVVFASCGEKFLNVPHYDILDPSLLGSSEERVNEGLNGLYDTFLPDKTVRGADMDIIQSWNLKPQFAFANYPSMDVGGGDWDKEFWEHSWVAGKDMFVVAWKVCYRAISRANTFLDVVEKADPKMFKNGEAGKKVYIAQARAIRGYYYLYLAQNFGRVPMLNTGETYSTSVSKPRPKDLKGTFDLILEDFEYAAQNLDWTPANGEYGRMTKGTAKAYKAWAYLYLKDYDNAKKLYEEIIKDGPYELLPSYGELHQFETYYTKESIWEVAFYKWESMFYGAEGKTEDVWYAYMLTASAEYNGWGGTYVSHEFCRSFEPGDKRRQYSVVAKGETHPYTGQIIGNPSGDYNADFVGKDLLPNNYVIKYWKQASPWTTMMVYTPISAIHMRYASVLLNYAECCFMTGEEDKGWEYIGKIRNRAWGNLEVGQTPSANFAASTLKYNDSIVEVPDAKTYYTQYKADKGYKSDVWKVALTIERRHEFFYEYEFWYHLTRTEMAQDFLDAEYPKNDGSRVTPDGLPRSPRTFDYNKNKELFPIPTNEILSNAEIGPEDQNPGY